MKKLFVVLILLVGMAGIGFSQETTVYTFFVNIVPEEFNVPLFGVVNIAKGDHTVPQFGFVNWNTGDFSSLQAGFVNTIGSNLNGAQVGFVNTVANDIKGSQVGYVNTARSNLEGAQVGFVNTVVNDIKGTQVGFINTAAGNIKGSQVGFVNTSAGSGDFQVGFVNTAAKKLKGIQIGFVNYAESIEDGVQIGFISLVRHGGYKAVEYSFSEFYPVNIEIKLGVEEFYTNIIAAYDPFENPFKEFVPKQIATGFGFGSIINISDYFFFNSEVNILSSSFSKENNLLLSYTPFFGFNINKYFSITVGPSVTWVHAFNNAELQKPVFKIMEKNIDENDSIVIGARAGARFRF